MKMKISRITALLAAFWLPLAVMAGINPQATFMEKDVETTDWKDISGDAPLHVRFAANATDLEEGSSIVWHLNHRTSGTSLTRYEESFEFDFVEAGITDVEIQLKSGDEVIEAKSLTVTISESFLEMPNAFTPNDDGHNDFYQAKSNYKSIISFHAYIFNRWGQKLYEWTDHTDVEKGWDGKFHGEPVKDGVYFVLVKARGADGREFNIRRDVNLLRRYNETTNSAANP